MKHEPTAELLWDAVSVDEGVSEAIPSDEELRAYRAGETSEVESRRIEWLLCRSQAARERLGDLAGVPGPTPPSRIRKRVLERGRKSRVVPPWIVLAAAVMIGAVGLGWGLLRPSAPPLPSFRVDVHAAQITRSLSEAPALPDRIARADLDTRVEVTVEAEGPTRKGLGYALYRRDAAGLRRIEESSIRLETYRGGARFQAAARTLTADRDGRHKLFVAVGPAGQLPQSVELRDSDDAQATLERLTGGRVYTRWLEVSSTVE